MRASALAIRLAIPAFSAGLLGCTSSVVVQSQFPVPLVQPLPITMGLFFEPELRDFIHAESIPQQSTWTIDLGDANLAMLSPLYDRMFERTQELASLPEQTGIQSGVDGVLRSALEKFEFDVPISGRDEFVEVWMQYRLYLYEPNGEFVAEWPVTGYGKAELDRNREDAVRRAAIVAMREAGATISTQFAQQPQVSYWLEEREDAAALSVDRRLAN
jgi:hypothetical protein